MLVTADWILPISRHPIRDGGVLVQGGRVVEVGIARKLEVPPVAIDHRHFDGCAIMPGLVNAHTHLSLTALAGLIGPSQFEVWLPQLIKAIQSWTPAEHAASAAMGVQRCLLSGVTVVGDIVYGPEPVSASCEAGLGGTFFWEVLGIHPERLFAELDRIEFPPVRAMPPSTIRVRYGLSPHSPYTSGPGLLKAVHVAAAKLGVPLAIHVAESIAESDLLQTGEGPLAESAGRLAKDFVAPCMGAVSYLDCLGVLDGATAIHLCQMLPAELPMLAANARGVVTCPRSNHYLGLNPPEINRMLRAGIPVGIGTDSQASNTDLDLMSELRELRQADSHLTYSQLLEMATAMGAITLGLEDRFGILECGMQADLAIFRVGKTVDPEKAVVEVGSAETLEAVLSAGVWRVLDSELCAPHPEITAAAKAATDRAANALRS